MESLKNKKAKGYSQSSQKYVEGYIYNVYTNGVGILTSNGVSFVKHGEYEIIETPTKKTL